jgi:hypothetical protein
LREKYEGATGNVVAVTDGDTLRVRLDSGNDVCVRILGIDSPETSEGCARLAPAAGLPSPLPRENAGMSTLEQVIAHLEPHLQSTPGPLDVGALDPERRELHDALPADLQALLKVWNGGVFGSNPGLGYSTGIESTRGETSSVGSDLWSHFFGFSPEAPQELFEYHRECIDDEFLPAGLVPIGHGLQHSIVLISTRDRDEGAVFYWEWYWQYPWYLPFFERRVAAALARFPEEAHDPQHPDHAALVDAANEATVVKLADALFPWLLSLAPDAGD